MPGNRETAQILEISSFQFREFRPQNSEFWPKLAIFAPRYAETELT
jgi:hypothetical protein